MVAIMASRPCSYPTNAFKAAKACVAGLLRDHVVTPRTLYSDSIIHDIALLRDHVVTPRTAQKPTVGGETWQSFETM